MELKVIFLEIVYLDLYSDKVWGFSIFSFCTPPGNIYGWPLLSILGDFWEKFICSSLPARLVEEIPASKVHLLTCNLTYWEVSQQTSVQILLASLGVVIGQNSALPLGRRGGGEKTIRNWVRTEVSDK